MKNSACDVAIVGGGPAGSTAGTILSEKGYDVVILEKEKFPRYHIGESMMPFCYFSLERLGLVDQMEKRGFVKKLCVQFVGESGNKSRPFYFFQHYDHPSSTTWQVNRSEFDEMLLRNAEEKGATVYEGTKVTSFLRDDNGRVTGVAALGEDGGALELNARLTIDASGRDAFAITKNKWRKRDPKLNKIAIWTYFRGAKRDEGLDAGATTVAYLPDKGWFWYIPLRDGITSVGIVAERDYLYRDSRDPAEIFARETKANAWIEDHLACGEQFGEYWVTGEYSYRSKQCAEDGLVLIGDAFSFLDPVFSSGMFLALKSGQMAADAVDEALSANDVSAERFEGYGEQLCRVLEIMRKFVYVFYDENFNFGKLIEANPDLKADVTDCLIGNIDHSDFPELFEAMQELASIPESLPYGRVEKELSV